MITFLWPSSFSSGTIIFKARNPNVGAVTTTWWFASERLNRDGSHWTSFVMKLNWWKSRERAALECTSSLMRKQRVNGATWVDWNWCSQMIKTISRKMCSCCVVVVDWKTKRRELYGPGWLCASCRFQVLWIRWRRTVGLCKFHPRKLLLLLIVHHSRRWSVLILNILVQNFCQFKVLTRLSGTSFIHSSKLLYLYLLQPPTLFS